MEPIYVTGHRNPDTDSIVSAMAYAALRNALGDREYIPACLGHISDETRRILDRFGFEAPTRIKTMRTQIRDLEYDTPPALHGAVTINRGWEALQSNTMIPAIPVTDDNGGLFGMLAPTDVAAYDMRTVEEPFLEQIPVFNLLSVLEGKLLGENSDLVDTITGEVIIALPQVFESLQVNRPDSIVLCGQQPDVIERALELNVACLILCQVQIPEHMLDKAQSTCIISTPFDAYRASRLVFQAMPVERICDKDDLVAVHLDDYLDDVRELVTQNRFRNYPILDENDRVVGTLSRFHLIRPRRKRVVLVDHNEFSQSVPGLEQAEILEIIDHHRLADIQTANPIYVRNEPVGSTATIVAGMYQEKGLMPSVKLAGLMAAAIISDTVMFKSPTCTERDIQLAERLARIGGLSLQELGKEIFSMSYSDEKSAKELLMADFKEFRIAGHYLAIGQITCVDAQKMLERKAEFLDAMREQMVQKDYSMTLLMLTDVLIAGSHLLYLGDEETIHQAFNVPMKDNECFLPKVISRKKQVVPMLSALWG